MSHFAGYSEEVQIAVIGGTGLYQLDHLEVEATLSDVVTPWGPPSSPIVIVRTPKGARVAFLSRHGFHHEYSPSTVPTRANIAALKKLGVRAIIAFSAVGSLREELRPRDFVLPDQVIDRTKGVRPPSFFDQGMVGHVGFKDPFDPALTKFVTRHMEGVMPNSSKFHTPTSLDRMITLICMEGPAFSTHAESLLYRQWGGDVINMSCLPEAKLAKEAEISYQMICMCTDYDAWRPDEAGVTVETVVGNLHANAASARLVMHAILEPLAEEVKEGRIGSDLVGSMKFSASTKPGGRDPKLVQALNWLHPGYYS